MTNEMAAFFDGLAPSWDNAPAEYGTREKLVSMMGLPPGGVTADIGCGKGVMLPHLLKTGPAKIIAIDISGAMLRAAKELFPDERIGYIHGNFLTAPLPVLDAAVIFNAYPHFTDKAALAEKLSRAVRQNGALIIAHGMGREKINGFHKGGSASKLSVPLESAEAEAGRFQAFFATELLVDNDEIFFIKMTRR